MSQRRQAGNSVMVLLLILASAAVAGTWNYRQNVAAEDDAYRPFRGYTDEAIADLMAAYEGREDKDQARYDRAAARRVEARGKSYFDEQVAEFGRVQQAHAAKAQAGDALAESRTTRKLLEEEMHLRASESDRVKLFLKRLLTIR